MTAVDEAAAPASPATTASTIGEIDDVLLEDVSGLASALADTLRVTDALPLAVAVFVDESEFADVVTLGLFELRADALDVLLAAADRDDDADTDDTVDTVGVTLIQDEGDLETHALVVKDGLPEDERLRRADADKVTERDTRGVPVDVRRGLTVGAAVTRTKTLDRGDELVDVLAEMLLDTSAVRETVT